MSATASSSLAQLSPRPSRARPIVILGTGGIVNDAHLPAYRKAQFPVAGLFDVNRERSRTVAQTFGIPRVFASMQEAVSIPDVVFDVAVPPEHILEVLEALPTGAAVLIQKPMGRDLPEARKIRQRCHEKKLIAAVNFQLRFSPMMLAIRDAVEKELLGTITDVEFRLNLRTPWEQFPFLTKLPRVEIQVHSIHYLDWCRSMLGEPSGVYALTIADPRLLQLKETRSSIILNYGSRVRCTLSINHNYRLGPRHEAAMVKVEGTHGVAVGTLGLLLNYPKGQPDSLEIVVSGQNWEEIPLPGNWFPDAFIGTMGSLQRFAAGEDACLPTSVEDSIKTMALVEACYQSQASGGTPIPSVD